MAEYLCPNLVLSVEEQRQIFQIRSRVNPLPSNKGEVSFCIPGCESILENDHILSCLVLNQEEQNNPDGLIDGNLKSMKKLLRIWNINMKKIAELTWPDSMKLLLIPYYTCIICCDKFTHTHRLLTNAS